MNLLPLLHTTFVVTLDYHYKPTYALRRQVKFPNVKNVKNAFSYQKLNVTLILLLSRVNC